MGKRVDHRRPGTLTRQPSSESRPLAGGSLHRRGSRPSAPTGTDAIRRGHYCARVINFLPSPESLE
jgi:hypothetical protein